MNEATEFWKIYQLDVIAIPPNRKVQRVDYPDKIYKTEKEKYDAVVDEIEQINKWDRLILKNGNEFSGTIVSQSSEEVAFIPKGGEDPQTVPMSNVDSLRHRGCPILVGTVSIQKSELLSEKLNRKGIKHQVLNAKPENVGREAEIIAQAGRLNAVTIATNMAGRGTDIILGGNPETLAWSFFQNKYPTRLDVPQDEWNAMVKEIEAREKMKEEGDIVRDLGGLNIIGTERHEARRIDLQLRGRCGRQGDPGTAKFFLSLEDDLVRIFAGDWVKNILTRLGMEDGQAIENKMVSRRIEGAQKKIEERNFETRKSLLDYDEVMDIQRKRVYSYRQRILDDGNTRKFIEEMIDHQLHKYLYQFLDSDYSPATFAWYASKEFHNEFDKRQFRSMTFNEAVEYARDYARRMAETQVLDAVEENLSLDVPEDEWNWQALTKFANRYWRAGLRDNELQKVGRDEVAQYLIQKASDYIDRVDLSRISNCLDPDYSLQAACLWVKNKFGITVSPESLKGMEPEQVIENLRKEVFAHYREKEFQFPVMASLIHYTIRDESGKRLNREGIIDWAKSRFGIDLPSDELKNMQRHEIEETLFKISRESSDRLYDDFDELKSRLNKIFKNQGVDIEKIRAVRQQKIERNEKILLDDRTALKKNDPDLVALCDWLNGRFDSNLTPAEICDWDVLLVENRLESVIEDKYNPEMRRVERQLILGHLDMAWKEHLLLMDHLKSSVGFRGYAQTDPKVEYKREGMKIFDSMWDTINDRVTDMIFRVEGLDPRFLDSIWAESTATHESYAPPAANAAVNEIRGQQEAAIDASKDNKPRTIRNKTKKVGPNAPCPCGSGKKYKKCCSKRG
jgi:preprotein translocase subunit SecA